MSLLRWTSESSTKLAEDLVRQGFDISARSVLRLLRRLGYSFKPTPRSPGAPEHPGRDAQFRYLNDMAAGFIADDQPVISVIPERKNWSVTTPTAGGMAAGRSAGTGSGSRLRDRALGERSKAIPYGIYDLVNDDGWVSVGDTADPSEFAVEAIRRWWHQMGRTRFPDAERLLITADAGGSNGYRLRAW